MSGVNNPFFGKKHYKETIEKRTQKVKGMFLGDKNPFYGKYHTDESKEKMRQKRIGTKASLDTRKKMSDSRKDKPLSEKHKKSLSLISIGKPQFWNRGEKCYLWKGGITSINDKIRHSIEYRFWRKSVFERDNYTCIWCGKIGGNLNADHIKRFSDYPELRLILDNGRTLCVPCHRITKTYGRKIIKINGE